VVLFIPHRANRGPTEVRDLSNFSRRKLQLRVAGVVRNHFSEVTCRSDKGGSGAWRELNIIDKGTDGDCAEWEAVTRDQWCILTDKEGRAYLHILRHNH